MKSLVQAGLSIDANLRAYYKLEDVNDSSANGYNLTNGGTATFTPGLHANALTLNGSSQYLVATSNLGITGTTNNFSGVAWIKLAGAPANNTAQEFIYLQIINGSNRYFYRVEYYNNAGTMQINHFRGTHNVTLTTGTWYHIAYTVNTSNNWVFYLNGVALGNGTAADFTTAGTNANQFGVGIAYPNSSGKTWYFNGQIDDVGIFNRVLTAAEILDIYAGGQPKVIMVD